MDIINRIINDATVISTTRPYMEEMNLSSLLANSVAAILEKSLLINLNILNINKERIQTSLKTIELTVGRIPAKNASVCLVTNYGQARDLKISSENTKNSTAS